MRLAALALVTLTLLACSEAADTTTELRTERHAAHELAQDYISAALVAPATADYPFDTVNSEPMEPIRDPAGGMMEGSGSL